MIQINQLKLPVTHTREELGAKICRSLRLERLPAPYSIRKQSLDARQKSDKKFVYTINLNLNSSAQERKILQKVHDNRIMLIEEKPYQFPLPGNEPLSTRPVIIGSGPAGLFCAWYLARAGYAPLVLERGEEAGKRQKKVEAFWRGGRLDPDCNVQFGEGGAGAFSDGKLNTLVKDPCGRNRQVLERFVSAGAPSEILYQQKPHLGTDMLVGIVENLRGQIEAMGGSFRFGAKVTDLVFSCGRLSAVEINEHERIPAGIAVLAPGHSARDTFAMLKKRGLYLEPKPFAVGLRIQHPQRMINLALYGEEENRILGAASYKLTHTCKNGRGVYTFCMCPGGYVVNASSEDGLLAVNGMSYQARDSVNANSALIVTVTPADFPGDGPLSGVEFQRGLERAAWEAGGGRVPIQLFGDYQKRRRSAAFGEVTPCIRGESAFSDVRGIFPAAIGDSIEEGIFAFGKKLPGFDRQDAILAGVESRTSSPVRIVRDRTGVSVSREGVYPCGEGAGYAGGITSAAMDGIKTAEAVAARYALPVCVCEN